MKVTTAKNVRIAGRDLLLHRYNMPFQGHQTGDFDLLEWDDKKPGWQLVHKGTSKNIADAIAQAKVVVH